MDRLIEGFTRFRRDVYPRQSPLYETLVRDGQKPEALVVSCSDSRVMPEVFLQCDPGDIFVARNAGNIVPPYGSEAASAVTSAIEYAVRGLGVKHIIVCGHTDCGAMKALLDPDALKAMPTVASWLGHCSCVRDAFVCEESATGESKARELAKENVAAQLENLETHPCVAASVASGEITLHGWLFDIAAGELLAMDTASGAFQPIDATGREARRTHLVAVA